MHALWVKMYFREVKPSKILQGHLDDNLFASNWPRKISKLKLSNKVVSKSTVRKTLTLWEVTKLGFLLFFRN